MRTLTAFVARSFDQRDDPKVQPILAHLETFHDLGFIWKTAEPAEVESVSEKVRKMIAESDVFVGILTQRHPVYEISASIGNAWRLFTNKLEPKKWSAPGWVLQESGFAIARNLKVILFVEPNLDFPLLQGDLEYIPYTFLNPTDALKRASEMINKLIAKQAGIIVETVVREEPQEEEKPEEVPPVSEVPEQAKEPEAAERGMVGVFDSFAAAIGAKDIVKARQYAEAGLRIIRDGKTSMHELAWRCYCLFRLFQAGDIDALGELEAAEKANPEDPIPPRFLADSLLPYKEYARAARYYKRAAELSKNDKDRSSRSLSAANAFADAGMPRDAVVILQDLLQASQEQIRTQAAQKLYGIRKSTGDHYDAFGLAEATLHSNPGLTGLRFEVGLDYHTYGQNELFMYHFDLLKGHDPMRSDVMHNVALAYSESGLPISSVSHYKRAIELGGSLAASNLAYKYLDAGMADEASEVLKEALKREDAAPNVGRCLAELDARQEKEGERYRDVLKSAEKQREFLVALGDGLYQTHVPSVDGHWRMPFGEIELRIKEGLMEGTAEVAEKRPSLSALFTLQGLAPGPETVESIQVYTFSGTITGAVCKFTVSIRPKTTPEILWGTEEKGMEGYLVFNADGMSARYAKLKEKKLIDFSSIERVG